MRVILGIDAAWTLTQPSGVALIVEDRDGWRLETVTSSYRHFEELAKPATVTSQGHPPNPGALLEACQRLIGRKPDLVAVDMPLSLVPIIGRRCADNDVSSAYGAKQSGTHSPSKERPGHLGAELCADFRDLGFPLWTKAAERDIAPTGRGLIEVYPHPALIELTKADQRLKYKISKIRQYWRADTPPERRQKIFVIWREIVLALDSIIRGVALKLPAMEEGSSGVDLKAFEDKLDAIVCAWVGACVLDNRAKAFGDEKSAIWVPLPI